jgi:hypothetical protein
VSLAIFWSVILSEAKDPFAVRVFRAAQSFLAAIDSCFSRQRAQRRCPTFDALFLRG